MILVLLLITLVACPAWAAQSTSYELTLHSAGGGGVGATSSESFDVVSKVGGREVGEASSASYLESVGFIPSIFTPPDITPPQISNVAIAGREVKDNDYVAVDAELSATITDGSGINTSTSYVMVDAGKTYFSALCGDISFEAASGALTYKLNISADGDHNLTIYAEDPSGNSATHEVLVNVDAGAVKARSVYVYPNPFNPSAGNMRLAYMLSKDAQVTIYIFNAINQLVWKRSYAAGASGGHVGYNEILWNGVSDFGEIVGNDAYFARLVADGKKVIGKVKIAVLR